MRYLKLFETITYTPEKLLEITSKYNDDIKSYDRYLNIKFNYIMSSSLMDFNSDNEKFINLKEELVITKNDLTKMQNNIERIIDMYSIIPSERPEGTHKYLVDLEYSISREIDDMLIELDEIIEYMDSQFHFIKSQNNNKIIKKILEQK